MIPSGWSLSKAPQCGLWALSIKSLHKGLSSMVFILLKYMKCWCFRFGGDKFSFSRMSWIKTNFLWMMYRCGWTSKPGQEHVLAVRITHEGFNTILSQVLNFIIYIAK